MTDPTGALFQTTMARMADPSRRYYLGLCGYMRNCTYINPNSNVNITSQDVSNSINISLENKNNNDISQYDIDNDTESRLELYSYANMPVLFKNVHVILYSGKPVEVSDYKPELRSINIPIVDVTL